MLFLLRYESGGDGAADDDDDGGGGVSVSSFPICCKRLDDL